MAQCPCLKKDSFCHVPLHNFRVELTASQTVPSDYTNFTQIGFADVVSDHLCLSTISAGTLTVAKSGTYSIASSLFWQDNPSNTREIIVRIADSDGVVQYSFSSATNVFGFEDRSSTSATLYIPAKSKISVYARQVAGVALQVLKSKSTFLEVNLLTK